MSALSCCRGGQFQRVRDCKSKLNLNPMEEEKHSQQPIEGNPNAYRSMRDYRNPPRMSAPSYIVPSTNVPYSNTYDPSWRNHQNFSWAPSVTPTGSRSDPVSGSEPKSGARYNLYYILYCTGTLIDLFFIRAVHVPVVYKQFL